MLSDYQEPFVRLIETRAADGLGGWTVALTDGETVLAGLAPGAAETLDVAGQPCARVRGVLTHDRTTVLVCGERLRRVRDGAEFVVTGDSLDSRTPDASPLALARTRVERLVIPS